LRLLEPYNQKAGYGSFAGCHKSYQQCKWVHSPFRPWKSVLLQRLLPDGKTEWIYDKHEPKGKLLESLKDAGVTDIKKTPRQIYCRGEACEQI